MQYTKMFGFHSSKRPVFILIICFCIYDGKAMSNSDYSAHSRFICSPIPPDADPGCFPNTGHHGGPGGSSWGMSEEAKTTILHLRESLVQQKEMLLDQRETIRELTAKLSLCQCEGFGGSNGNHEDRPHLAHHAHHAYPSAPDPGHLSWTGHHRGKASPEHSRSQAGGHHGSNHRGYHGADGYHSRTELSQHEERNGVHHSNKGVADREKHLSGEIHPVSASPETMSRMLHNLKERLHNLQTRNTSSIYSSSLKDLLQRKISALEQQMQHHSSPLTAHTEHEHEEDDEHHVDEHHSDDHNDDDDDDHHDSDHPDDDHHEDGYSDQSNHHGENEDHEDAHDESRHSDHHSEHEDHDEGEEDDHREKEHDHDNEVSPHRFERLTYDLQSHRETPGSSHSKLDAVLSQLQHRLSEGSRKKSKMGESFQIGFPMRSNFMYGRVKRTLLQEIFSFTLCLWVKAGTGPGIGTPFSYSSPGQSNEIVLIEWGNNPMELLVDDQAATLPLSLSDGKWHHVCVTWSTRDGLWEAYQDGVKRGSGENLSAWHPIKPGGVFILGQEQDTLGGRFDATQAFVGEISDVQMWSHVLTAPEVYGLATCGGHMTGDIIAWSEGELELHGGVTKYPFHPCD